MKTTIATWEETAARFRRVVDKLGKPIDAGIFETVVALNMAGITTRASCEGHLDWGVPHPWVDVEPELENKYRLHQLLTQFYAQHHADFDCVLCFHGYRLRCNGAPFAEMLSDDERACKLAAYQAEMAAFTEYLRFYIKIL